MDATHHFSKLSEGLLAPEEDDEDLYPQNQHKGTHRYAITAALTVVNLAAFLVTAVFWLSSAAYDGCVPRLAGAGDMRDALDAHAIEYEVRSYSKTLEYDHVSRKAIIASDSDRNYAGPPSLEIDAAWNELLRGKCRLLGHLVLSAIVHVSPTEKLMYFRSFRRDDAGGSQAIQTPA
jgi:hypothetical protein